MAPRSTSSATTTFRVSRLLAAIPRIPILFSNGGSSALPLGGPIRHDRIFFFANWERNEQRGSWPALC